jgi:hypothetical protein
MLSACKNSKWHNTRQETPLQSEDSAEPSDDESGKHDTVSCYRHPITEERVGRNRLSEGRSQVLAIRLRSKGE